MSEYTTGGRGKVAVVFCDGVPIWQDECCTELNRQDKEVERLRAIVKSQSDLLRECALLLTRHHGAEFVSMDWAATSVKCPVCSKGNTEEYPHDIFGRITAAEKARTE